MAGFATTSYHTRHKQPGWRRRRVINFTAGDYTAPVVVIFAIVKFTEGAWLVVAVPGPDIRVDPDEPAVPTRSRGGRSPGQRQAG